MVEGLKDELSRQQGLVEELDDALGDDGDETEELDVVNKALMKGIRTEYASKFGEIRAATQALSALFQPPSMRKIDGLVEKWVALRGAFEKQYEAAKTRAKANQQQLDQIREVEKRIGELKRLLTENRKSLAKLGEPLAAYRELKGQWNKLHAKKASTLDERCQTFSQLSEGLIRADMKGSLDVDLLKQNLKKALSGFNIRDQKLDDVCRHVVESDEPIVVWDRVLAELEALALHGVEGPDALPTTPILSKFGLVNTERARIASGMDTARWFDLSITDLEFNPVFRYCTNKSTSEYIDFADASAGQQATALLTVLLSQPGAPLVIDQPEDDVDSKLSPDIVRQIWAAKGRRQLVFASHNANFVVNGDAELVICCDYVKVGDQTGGRIKTSGAIDNREIREEITSVTEGGKDAFKLRKEKYGF